MGLIIKGIKYGAVALAARHSGKASADVQNQQQQQAIVNHANSIIVQQAAEHEQEQQSLVAQANHILAQQQAEHEQALKQQEEKLRHQQAQQPMYVVPVQQALPAPPNAYGPSAPGTPYSQPSTPGTPYRDMSGYPHQGWCNQQCGQTCNANTIRNAESMSTVGYGPSQSPAPGYGGAYQQPAQPYPTYGQPQGYQSGYH